jgi:PEP-CTERM motif-containing protein
MSNTATMPATPAGTRKKTSTKVRLIHAAALAAVLVPLGSVAVESSSITCGFYGGSGCAGSGNERVFDFHQFGSSYKVKLEFDNVNGPFDITIQDFFTSQGALSSGGRLTNFPNHTCVTIRNLTDCVEFEVSAPPPGPTTWSGFYNLFIFWDTNTNSAFPNGPGYIRMLHDIGGTGPAFDSDITIAGSYFPGTPTTSDPGIGGRDNNFQSFIVTSAVPEPGTMLLLGSGISAILYHRRRRRRDPEGPTRR